MDRKLFEQLVRPLGEFRRNKGGHAAEGGYEDLVFIPTKLKPICPSCDQSPQLYIEKKRGYKDIPYWRVKCPSCKDTWQLKTSKLD